MKVDCCYEDKLGRNPIVFSKYRSLKEVYDFLWQHYQGYHFTIMLDCTKSEYEGLDDELYVYFSDEALEEIAVYSDVEIKKKNWRGV